MHHKLFVEADHEWFCTSCAEAEADARRPPEQLAASTNSTPGPAAPGCVCGRAMGADLTIACSRIACGRLCHPKCVDIDVEMDGLPDLPSWLCPSCPRYPARRRSRTPKAVVASADIVAEGTQGPMHTGRAAGPIPVCSAGEDAAAVGRKRPRVKLTISGLGARKASGGTTGVASYRQPSGPAKAKNYVVFTVGGAGGSPQKKRRPKLISTELGQLPRASGWRVGGTAAQATAAVDRFLAPPASLSGDGACFAFVASGLRQRPVLLVVRRARPKQKPAATTEKRPSAEAHVDRFCVICQSE